MKHEMITNGAPEHKYMRGEHGLTVKDGFKLEGYASIFGLPDQSGDIVLKGAFSKSLQALSAKGETVKMLWQHDPQHPIGVWTEVIEDATGLWVKGHLLHEVDKGREAAALLAAGAIDGLSIGYRTIKSGRDENGHRLLSELQLWEVSLVTFPMLKEARAAAKSTDDADDWREMASLIQKVSRELAEW